MIRRVLLLTFATVAIAVASLVGGAWWFFVRDPLGAFRTYRGHRAPVNSVAFDASGKYLVTAGDDSVNVWNADSMQTIDCAPALGLAAQFLEGAESLVYADQRRGIVFRDVRGRVDERVIENAACRAVGSVHIAMAVSRDRKWIAASFARFFNDPPRDAALETYAINVWNLDQPDKTISLAGHEGPVMALALHPNKPILASSGRDQTDRIWDLSIEKQVNQIGTAVPLLKQTGFVSSHVVLEFNYGKGKGDATQFLK